MGDDGTPKLPKGQLTILAVARFAEPLAYTSVNPYLPAMVLSFGTPRRSIARTAGLITSTFSLFQSLTAVPWGKASDIYGRKPIIILGLVATMLCFLVWGTSTSVPMAITVRAIQGASNGNVGIIRTMVAEMVPYKALQPRAFSIMPLVWSMGSVLGPSFGGSLAEPVKQYPWLFGGNQLLTTFPFLLPNLVAALFFIISTISAAFFLKETLPSKRHDRDWGLLVGQKLTRALRSQRAVPSRRRSSFVDGEATAPLLPSVPKPASSKAKAAQAGRSPGYAEVFTYQTVVNLAAYTFLAFHSVAYDQNIPVFMSYPVEDDRDPSNTQLPFKFSGGFGLEPGEIGTIFTAYGVACCVVQFVAYPPLATKLGVLKTLKLCCTLMPIVYFLTPFTALPSSPAARLTLLLLVMALKAFCVIIAFPSTTILLTNSAASLNILGTLNGFATMFSGLGRAAGPFSTGLVFDWGAERGYIISAYWFLGLVSLLGAVPVWLIVEGDGPGAADEGDAEDESEDSEDSDSEGSALVNVNGVLLEEEAIVDSEEEEEEADPAKPLMGQREGYGTVGGNGVRA